jgi:nucleotidyltransferase substrate binding protein (TIGR01987 family)
MQDIRWIQRLDNYMRAQSRLEDAVSLAEERTLSNLELQGLIQAFEFTYELACNLMKDYLNYQGIVNINGCRDAIRLSFKNELIEDADSWMDMIVSRNKSSHTYNEAVATEISEKIIVVYHGCFKNFLQKMNSLKNERS